MLGLNVHSNHALGTGKRGEDRVPMNSSFQALPAAKARLTRFIKYQVLQVCDTRKTALTQAGYKGDIPAGTRDVYLILCHCLFCFTFLVSIPMGPSHCPLSSSWPQLSSDAGTSL